MLIIFEDWLGKPHIHKILNKKFKFYNMLKVVKMLLWNSSTLTFISVFKSFRSLNFNTVISWWARMPIEIIFYSLLINYWPVIWIRQIWTQAEIAAQTLFFSNSHSVLQAVVCGFLIPINYEPTKKATSAKHLPNVFLFLDPVSVE